MSERLGAHGHIKFAMPHPNGHVEKASGYMSLKFGREIYAGGIN